MTGLTASGRIVARVGLRLPVVLLLASVLICYAPGFDSDERQLDLRLDSQTIEALRQSRSQFRNPLKTYGRYLAGILRGDFGQSETFNRPVSELLADRYPVTLRAVGTSAVIGFAAAALLASCVSLLRSRPLQGSSGLLAGMLLCVPSALLAFGAVVLNGQSPQLCPVLFFRACSPRSTPTSAKRAWSRMSRRPSRWG